MLSVMLFIFAGLTALGMLTGITLIGKPRKPITPGYVITSMVFNSIFLVVMVLAAIELW